LPNRGKLHRHAALFAVLCWLTTGCLGVAGGYTRGFGSSSMPDGASIDVHLGYLNPSDRIGGTVATRIKLLGKDGYQVAITPAVVGAYPLAGRESKLFGYAIAGINVAQFERHSYGMFGPVGGLGLLWIPMTLVHRSSRRIGGVQPPLFP
jgi:hypothetical protein